jgi:hypothetical protein
LEDHWRRSSSAAVAGNTAAAPTNATAPIKTSQRFNLSDIVLVRLQASEGTLGSHLLFSLQSARK